MAGKVRIVDKVNLYNLAEEWAAEEVESAAKKVESTAKTIAPVDTGKYRDSIKAEKVSELHWIVRTDAVGPQGQHYSPIVESREGIMQKAARSIK